MIRNIIALLTLLLAFIVVLYFILKSRIKQEIKEEDDIYSLRYLVNAVKEHFNEIIGKRIDTIGDEAAKRKEAERIELSKAVRNCSNGCLRDKLYVKEHIKKWLFEDYIGGKSSFDMILPFEKTDELSAADKFEILLYDYWRDHRFKAAARLIGDLLEVHGSITPGTWQSVKAERDRDGKERNYVINSADVEELYCLRRPYLDTDAKADIITQYIYRQYKGHGVIDSLRDQEIDGISAGVSGIVTDNEEPVSNLFGEWTETVKTSREGRKNYESVWVFCQGNMVHLTFLGFGSRAELERVCKNVYRYNNPGQLSASKGFIANDMYDGSRVIVVRPPFAESWAFFIRKFGKKGTMPVNRLIQGQGSRDVYKLLKHIVSGCQVFGITGEQGCGKTTLLKALIEFIPENYTLRIQELLFELHLRDEYPERNIITFRETGDITGRDALDLQKKTDGMVNIIGEVASAPVAGWLVQVSQVASRFTIFTHHAKTTENLIAALRNDLMTDSGFNNEEIAESQVRQAVRFDVHMVRLPDGSRKILRITEIARDGKDPEGNRPLMVLGLKGYEMVNPISEQTAAEMLLSMGQEEACEFRADQERWKKGDCFEEGYSA